MPGGFNLSGDQSLDQVLVRRLLMPGGGVASTVAPEMMPVIALEVDRPEWHILANSGLYSRGGSNGAGGAGTRSVVTLMNYLANTLVVVERVVAVAASGLMQLHVQKQIPGVTLGFGTNTRGVARDTRLVKGAGSELVSACLVNIANSGAAITTAQSWAQASLDFAEPIVLAPGGWLSIQPSADNVAITSFGISWRERALNPSEFV